MTTQPNAQVSAAATLRHEELLRLIRQFDDEIGIDTLSEVITELPGWGKRASVLRGGSDGESDGGE